MTGLVLTPFHGSAAIELAARQWWKRLLPIGEIDYKGRRLKFDRGYLSDLVSSFQAGAYDQVAFQLADSQNTHTNDPERFRGDIAEMVVRDNGSADENGLWIRLKPTDNGDKVLRENPNLGVSARIVEGYERADGKKFPAAIQHVLGTLDPRIPGLGPWQAIEAANPAPDRVVDLSGAFFAGEEPPAPTLTEPEKGTGMDLSKLSAEHQARLEKLLGLPDETLDALAAGGMVLTADEIEALAGDGTEGGDAGMSDADLDALTAAAEEWDAAGLLDDNPGTGTAPGFTPGYQPEGEPVGAALSAEAQFAIDLANARAEETSRELSVVTARLREEDYQAEKRKLADLGVPVYITELARPLLEGAGHAVELANGKTVDAGAIMRRVLSEYASQVRLLDLDVELGSAMDEPEDAARETQATSRDDLVSRYKAVTGLR